MLVFKTNKQGSLQLYQLWRPSEAIAIGQKMLDMFLCPQYRVEFDRLCKASHNKLEQRINTILNKKVKMNQVADELDSLVDAMDTYLGYALIHDPLQSYCDHLLSNHLSDPSTVIALMTPAEDTFSMEILRHLYDCAIAYETKSGKLNSLLQEHSDKFHWKRNSAFNTTRITAEDVLKEVKEHGSKHYNNLIESADKSKLALLQQKSEVISKLPAFYRNVVDITDVYGPIFTDARKRLTTLACAAFDKLLHVVAQSMPYPIEDLRYLVPQELRHFIANPTGYKQRFVKRKKLFVLVQTDFPMIDEIIETTDKIMPMNEPFIAEGENAVKALKKLNERLNFFVDENDNNLQTKTLKGTVAYKDKDEITGTVRIILNPTKETVKDGEILVAPTTTPNYLESMGKCLAIITDFGGQTSHAAIVSRELRKPCIINTGIASHVLENGQKIRMNFVDGTIEVMVIE